MNQSALWQQVLDGTGGDWCRVKAVISAFDGLLAAEEEAKVNGGNFFSNDVVLSLNVYIYRLLYVGHTPLVGYANIIFLDLFGRFQFV